MFAAHDFESARRARREFSAFMSRSGARREAVDDSTLIFGELVGNAVRHVGGEIHARLMLSGTQPVLCVTDCAPDAMLRIPRRDPRSESGRGLKIAIALARRVWVERQSASKTICAALPCDIMPTAEVERGEVPA